MAETKKKQTRKKKAVKHYSIVMSCALITGHTLSWVINNLKTKYNIVEVNREPLRFEYRTKKSVVNLYLIAETCVPKDTPITVILARHSSKTIIDPKLICRSIEELYTRVVEVTNTYEKQMDNYVAVFGDDDTSSK